MLLHVVDQLEANDQYINFLREKKFINNEAFNVYQEIFQESIADVKVPKRSRDLEIYPSDQSRVQTKPVRLRIVSIERDSGESKIPFLAMDQREKFLTGTIDDLLVTDDMIPDSLIGCTPTDLDYDEQHITLSKEVSYIKTLENDPSFPKPDENTILNIRVRDHELEEFRPYILQATILQTPEITEITRTDGKTISVTYTTISDGHGQINLYQYYSSSLSQFSAGDRIKVMGAVAFYGTEGEVELSMSPYASIVK